MSAKNIAVAIFAIFLASWVLGPIIWLVLTSLQAEAQIRTVPPSVSPSTILNYLLIFDFQKYSQLFVTSATIFIPTETAFVLAGLRNSTIIAIEVVLVNMVAGTFAAYTFARIKFKGSWPLFIYAIASKLIPGVAIIIPFYVIIRLLNLLDTTFAVFLVYASYTLPLSIWILYIYLSTVPTEIEESAFVDGYSRFETLARVVFPVIRPGIVAVAIFSFMFSYTEFFFASLLTETSASQTLPVVVAGIGSDITTPITLMAATGVIAMIPPLVIFLIFRRYIISGLASGAVK